MVGAMIINWLQKTMNEQGVQEYCYASMKRILSFGALVLVTASCSRDSSPVVPSLSGHSIFDTLLSRPSVSERVKQAELDLPGDVYKSAGVGTARPMHWNDSRQTRELDIGRELLRELQPALKRMSVSDLISAMKLYPRLTPTCPSGVAYVLYGEGNKMIIDEIESRPVQQLAPLNSLAKDQKYEVFLNGTYSEDLGILCQMILKKKELWCPISNPCVQATPDCALRSAVRLSPCG